MPSVPCTQPRSADVLVLGAGWAGLTAALRLAEHNKSVLLVEARPRLGGRAFTHTYSESTLGSNARTAPGGSVTDPGFAAVDFGCSWIHGYKEGNPVKGICERLGIPVTIASERPSAIVGRDGLLPQALTQKLQRNFASAQASASSAVQDSECAPHCTTSLASHFFAPDSPLFSDLTCEADRDLARAFCRQLHIPLGTELENVSLRWHKFEQSYAGTDAAPEGGFSRVITALAEELHQKGVQYRMNESVLKIECHNGSLRVVTRNAAGTTAELTSKAGIVTFPLATLKRSARTIFHPPLTIRKQAAIQRVMVGDLNKVLLVYSAAWWPANVGSFTVLRTTPDSLAGGGPETILASTTMLVTVEATRMLVMIGGQAGSALENFRREEVVHALHAYLSARLQCDTPAQTIEPPVHHFMSRWSSHELTCGATTTPVAIGENNSPLDFAELSRPEYSGLLGFAGEHTDMHHRGSVAGAVLSGEREAQRLCAHLDNH